MLQKLWTHKSWLAFFSAFSLVLAYAPIHWVVLSLFLPFFLCLLIFQCQGFWQGFRWGFLQSFFIMLGGFYWVIYVIKVFGFLPWSISFLLYLGFCGFGALNFPLFTAIAAELHRRLQQSSLPRYWGSLWFSIGLPTLFIFFEWAIPKLFPWYIGHAWYRFPILIQITEITGSLFLSFAMCSLSFVAAGYFFQKESPWRVEKWAWAIPSTLWATILVFGCYRWFGPGPDGREFRVALIQANIGSLDRLGAAQGIGGKVRHVISTYERLTEEALNSSEKPDLILWPETAMPFQLEGPSQYAKEIREKVIGWGVPLITGAYAQSPYHFDRDFNAAFLLEPNTQGALPLKLSIAPKNVLLAFGEYMPLGDTFPKLYEWFPQVSNFEMGRTHSAFQLSDDTRLGVTICYEAILPTFVRRVAQLKAHALINLTNDSWFGPTSEPYQHAQLSVFRAVETRMPLIRVTNTGTSFTVDTLGRMGPQSAIEQEAVVSSKLRLPKEPPQTFYVRFGEWFLSLCLSFLGLLTVIALRKSHAPISR